METTSHPAVIATRPAKEPLNVMETSGFPYLIHVVARATKVAAAAARFVVIAMSPRFVAAPVVEPQLNPNQQNHRMKTPNTPSGRLCPGIPFTEPSLLYFPILGPNIFAPMKASTPPTICTAVDPAKSWNPRFDSQPPPQIQ